MKKKVKLNYTSRLIKRLLKKHKCIRLEVYRRDAYSRRRDPFTQPYGMRHIYPNGNCKIRYWNEYQGFKGRGKQQSCFEEEVNIYTNGFGDEIVKRDINSTLRAMQYHDRGYYKVKYIYAGDWTYEMP